MKKSAPTYLLVELMCNLQVILKRINLNIENHLLELLFFSNVVVLSDFKDGFVSVLEANKLKEMRFWCNGWMGSKRSCDLSFSYKIRHSGAFAICLRNKLKSLVCSNLPKFDELPIFACFSSIKICLSKETVFQSIK